MFEIFLGANAEANFTAFSLNSSTGLIETAEILNYEDIKEYLLCVRVLSAQATHNFTTFVNDDGQVQQILVSVRDSNDNGPVFPDTEIFAGKYNIVSITINLGFNGENPSPQLIHMLMSKVYWYSS